MPSVFHGRSTTNTDENPQLPFRSCMRERNLLVMRFKTKADSLSVAPATSSNDRISCTRADRVHARQVLKTYET